MKKYFEIPTECPECGNELKIDGKFLVCDEKECPGTMIGTIMKWLDVTGMKSQGIGEKTILKLFASGIIQFPSDLYKLTKEHFEDLEGFGNRSATKIIDIIQSHKEVTLSQFIGGLNLKNFSTSMAELLVKNGYDTFEKMLNISIKELVKIKGIEEKTAITFIEEINDKYEVAKWLLEKVIITTPKQNGNGKLSGLSFCFTGAMSHPRKELEKMVEDNGGTIKSVSKGLTYLVQSDPTSTSGKSKKAKQLGIQIISEENFMKMVRYLDTFKMLKNHSHHTLIW